MNTDRMKEAITVLRTVSAEKLPFDYTQWGETDTMPEHIELVHTCDTVACAAGYLTLYKPFQALGLTPKSMDCLRPRFEDLESTEALAAFFDIKVGAADAAFVNLNDVLIKSRRAVTANDVADYLQVLLVEELASKTKEG